MRQSILFKTVMVAGGIAAFGGAVFLGVTHGMDGAGDTAVPEPLAELTEVFADAELGISFRYPTGFRATAFAHDEQSDVVLVEGGEGQSFQVFTQPFDEDVALSPERIRQDVPDKVIDDPHPVMVAGVPALAFLSDEPELGRVYEVWFVHNGTLYEVTTYADFAPTLTEILATWSFDR